MLEVERTESISFRISSVFFCFFYLRWSRSRTFTPAPQHCSNKSSFLLRNWRWRWEPVLRSRSRLVPPLIGRLRSRFFCWSEPGAGAAFFFQNRLIQVRRSRSRFRNLGHPEPPKKVAAPQHRWEQKKMCTSIYVFASYLLFGIV